MSKRNLTIAASLREQRRDVELGLLPRDTYLARIADTVRSGTPVPNELLTVEVLDYLRATAPTS